MKAKWHLNGLLCSFRQHHDLVQAFVGVKVVAGFDDFGEGEGAVDDGAIVDLLNVAEDS